MGELVSGADLARRLKISKQAVSKAKGAGRIMVAGHDDRGRPLYDFEAVNRIFSVDYSQVDRVVDPGGRPIRRQGGKSAPPLPPAANGPALNQADGLPLDWFSRYDLETCFPGIGREMDAGHLMPVGKFPGGGIAFSWDLTLAFLEKSFPGIIQAIKDGRLKKVESPGGELAFSF